MLRYLSAGVICSEKRTLFRQRISRKTVNFEEQITSKDKFLSIFQKSDGRCCVYCPSNIFHKAGADKLYRRNVYEQLAVKNVFSG